MESQTLLPDLSAFPPRRKYLIGVSGGCDSMVLLQSLWEAGYKRLVVCHLNHRLRGRASQADAALVEKAAAKLELKFIGDSAPVATLASEGKQSLETAAREARHAFFARCAAEERCHDLFLAHHADDQAETVLMNVLRGSGLRGLGGMRMVSELTVPGRKRPLQLIRPLLGVWRTELRKAAAAQSISFREDASNQSGNHLRNRLRHVLLPMATTVMSRPVGPALLRLALVAQDEDDVLAASVAEFPTTGVLSTKAILALPVALQRRVIHAWLKGEKVPSVNFELVETIRQLLPPESATAKCNLPGGRFARRRAGMLFLEEGVIKTIDC